MTAETDRLITALWRLGVAIAEHERALWVYTIGGVGPGEPEVPDEPEPDPGT